MFRPPVVAIVVAFVVAFVVACRLGSGSQWPAAAADPPPASTPGIFGLTAPGQRFVYVFDRSASMSEPQGRPLAAAKRELLASIEALGDARQFHVIFYNERPTIYAPRGGRGRPIFADEEQVREVRRFVADVRADGGTRHHEALAAALRLAPDVIFMLTDADAEDDLTEDELGWLSRSLSGTRCMVVQFGAAAGRRSPRLARLAAESGGTYKVMDPDAGP